MAFGLSHSTALRESKKRTYDKEFQIIILGKMYLKSLRKTPWMKEGKSSQTWRTKGKMLSWASGHWAAHLPWCPGMKVPWKVLSMKESWGQEGKKPSTAGLLVPDNEHWEEAEQGLSCTTVTHLIQTIML